MKITISKQAFDIAMTYANAVGVLEAAICCEVNHKFQFSFPNGIDHTDMKEDHFYILGRASKDQGIDGGAYGTAEYQIYFDEKKATHPLFLELHEKGEEPTLLAIAYA